jgi:arylsulfatase A
MKTRILFSVIIPIIITLLTTFHGSATEPQNLLNQNISSQNASSPKPPNVVILFADDMGYGDLACYGAKNWKTPNLDHMANEGMRFTDFYVAQAVCSASRAGLLTGCYPNRVGISGALMPTSPLGLSDKEKTIAHLCKSKNYSTAAVGKWHLGCKPEFLPLRRGFDSYLGLPYSNDMWPKRTERPYPPLPLYDGEKVIVESVDADVQTKLTEMYTQRAVNFIQSQKDKPYFLYMAYAMPHVPLFAGEKFRGSSKSAYGDVIQEVDASVGRILEAIKASQQEENTVVFFTSDNGPWLSYGNHAGSSGPLREGKGTAWEGGTRVPCIARWPGKIPAGKVCTEPLMTIDILPTVAKWIDAKLPDHPIDGKDISNVLKGEPGAKSPHDSLWFYYNDNELHAVRSGKWKLVLPHTYRTMNGQPEGKDGEPGKYRNVKVTKAELYDLVNDVGETKNQADEFPTEMAKLMKYAEQARKELGDSLTKQNGSGRRPAGKVE